MGNVRWHADAVEGGLSSIDVLFQWLAVPENVARWLEPALTPDGEREAISNEVYEMMLAHHITHRTLKAIEKKLYFIRHKFDRAEAWLERKGICYCDANSKQKHKLEKICPDYPKLAVLLDPSRISGSTRKQVYVPVWTEGRRYGNANGMRTKRNADNRAEEKVKAPEIGFKRDSSSEPEQRSVPRIEALSNLSLRATPLDVRREMFRLEIQIKRDQAICVRAKSRKELLSLGISMEEVDRLMPL